MTARKKKAEESPPGLADAIKLARMPPGEWLPGRHDPLTRCAAPKSVMTPGGLPYGCGFEEAGDGHHECPYCQGPVEILRPAGMPGFYKIDEGPKGDVAVHHVFPTHRRVALRGAADEDFEEVP
jgi:hypothetical protein